DLNLTAASDLGWATTIVGTNPISVAGLAQSAVVVQVQVPPGTPADTVARVTLTATDPMANSTGSSSSDITVFQPNYTLSTDALVFGSQANGSTSSLSLTLNNSGATVQVGTVGSPNGLAA